MTQADLDFLTRCGVAENVVGFIRANPDHREAIIQHELGHARVITANGDMTRVEEILRSIEI